MTAVGILHPGAMGAALAGIAGAGGAVVRWASRGRSEATARRAEAVGAIDAESVEDLCRGSDVVVSICPPAAAESVAATVAASGFGGCYVDANAISPTRMGRVATLVAAAGATVVDGAVIGPVPRRRGTTRLYLAGEGASGVAELFVAGPLEAVVLERPVGAASGLKMAYAASTKGTIALTALCLAMAAEQDVTELLAAEWDRDDPGATAAACRRIERGAAKAWRWVGEMEEVADTAAGLGLPDGFHIAAARTFDRWSAHRDRTDADIDALLAELPGPPAGA